MIYEMIIQVAIEHALEELEGQNMIQINNTREIASVKDEECMICFDKYFSNNLKILSCNKHYTCYDCWDNYVKSRLDLSRDTNTCFICFRRDSLLNLDIDEGNANTDIDNINEPEIDPFVISLLRPFNTLFYLKYNLNNINYNNMLISIYQADFKYINTNKNDVLINLINNKYMFHKYGLALTLYQKAKHSFGQECLDWVAINSVVPKNGVVVTNGGEINAKIIHCNSPNPAGKNPISLRNSLEMCYINVFEKILNMDNVKRIFLPGIFARRVEDYDDGSIKIAVKALYDILCIYLYDFKQKGINEINIIDYGKNQKILGYLSGHMNKISII